MVANSLKTLVLASVGRPSDRRGLLRSTTAVTTATDAATAAKKYQARRQLSLPPQPRMRGTTAPTTTSPTAAPDETMVDASPESTRFEPGRHEGQGRHEHHAVAHPRQQTGGGGCNEILGQAGEKHASGGDDDADAHDEPGTELRRQEAPHKGHRHVSAQIPGGERAGGGAAQAERLLHLGEDGAVAEAPEADGREDAQGGRSQDDPAVRRIRCGRHDASRSL